jgi:hypothetical protein
MIELTLMIEPTLIARTFRRPANALLPRGSGDDSPMGINAVTETV